MIIVRYITKEILLTFIAVTSVLLLVALSNRFIIYLAKAAVGQLPAGMILQTVGLYIPEFFGLLAPLGLFIGILLAHGRLHADNEITVMLTGGSNWADLVKIALTLALAIAGIVFILMVWIVPSVTEQREQILSQGESVGIMQAITPGQFQIFNDGKVVFYVEDVDENKTELRRVFIADNDDAAQANTTITAQSGYLNRQEDEQSYFLVLKNGQRYTGQPGSADYTTIEFAEYGRELKAEAAVVGDFDRLKPSSELWFSDKIGDQAELQWRLAMPLSVLVLTVIAVPIAKVSPRQGRFAKFLPAILLYIVYYNLMTLAKRWVGAGILSPYLGIWSVHLLFLVVGGLLLAYTSGRLMQLYHSVSKKHLNNKS